MSRIAEVVSTDRTTEQGVPVLNVQCDLGGGQIVTAQHMSDAGDDAVPLPGDFVLVDEAGDSGQWQVVGYHDPSNAGTADIGERRFYARSSDGAPVVEFWLKKDGKVSLKSLVNSTVEMTWDPVTGTVTHKCTVFQVDADELRLGKGAGKAVACVGDLVAVVVPTLLSSAPGNPCLPAIATLVTPTGYAAAGQIISGRTTVKAGP